MTQDLVETKRVDGDDKAEWPYASLLLFGFFGAHTPAGKRLVRETAMALFLIVGSMVLVRTGVRAAGLLGAVMLPGAVAWIGWAYARYLRALDELGRTMQLKAFAFSYGVAMTLAAAVAGLGTAGYPASGIEPMAFLVILVLTEPIRGLALAVLARRYR